MSREELIELVQRIIDGEGDEDQHLALVLKLEENVLHPRVTDLIYREGLPAEQVVDKALAYKPIAL
jgi:hypothetical protein